jgi:hypothetical protein
MEEYREQVLGRVHWEGGLEGWKDDGPPEALHCYSMAGVFSSLPFLLLSISIGSRSDGQDCVEACCRTVNVNATRVSFQNFM